METLEAKKTRLQKELGGVYVGTTMENDPMFKTYLHHILRWIKENDMGLHCVYDLHNQMIKGIRIKKGFNYDENTIPRDLNHDLMGQSEETIDKLEAIVFGK